MLKMIQAISGLLISASAALAQGGAGGYLIYSSQALCLTRSQQMCTAMGCDGVNVIYWWDCSTALQSGTVGANAVTAGSFAMRIDSGQFGPTASNNVSGGTQGLTAQEQSSLVTPATANANTVFPWVLTVAAFKARFQPTQITAMTNSTDTNINPTWANLGAAAVVNLQSASIITMVNAAVADGIITQANANTILAPSIAAVQPSAQAIP